ncbi:MAG: glycosyltransferase family 8 protein [Oscillospiraceae bacterium]|jgi:lipopolysaccharide biosynthesis glycosyltransferase
MNIVYASDNNYAEILGVSLVSLFENNKQEPEMTVYILDDHISEGSKEKLNDIFAQYGRKGVFLSIPDLNRLAGIQINSQRWSLSAFSRLFLSELLPKSVEKILYLDCDLLIECPLKQLWCTNIENYVLAAVSDCISPANKKNIGLDVSDMYINTGVLFINMNEWRKQNVQRLCIEFIQQMNGKIPYVDQGVLNNVLKGKMKELPLRYNAYTVLYDFSYQNLIKYRKPLNFYKQRDVEEAVKQPAIVHFTASFLSLRPWIKGSSHPYVGEWLRFKAMTPWRDLPLWEDNRSGYKKAYEKFYRTMPQPFSVWLSGLLHSKIVPLIRAIKK